MGSNGVAAELGYRLASLADGEGCFVIGEVNKTKIQSTFACSFVIKMRADDAALLERFHDLFEMGNIHHGKAWRTDGAKRNPWVAWNVCKKVDCLRLVDIFDEYPLWSRKQEQYLIWRDAVIEWGTMQRGDLNDYSAMANYRRELRAARSFVAALGTKVPRG